MDAMIEIADGWVRDRLRGNWFRHIWGHSTWSHTIVHTSCSLVNSRASHWAMLVAQLQLMTDQI